MNPDWSNLLQATRAMRASSDSSTEFWLVTIPPHFAPVTDQLVLYDDNLLRRRANVDGDEKLDKKKIILETRSALRFGLSCMSVLDENIRRSLQISAVFTCSWHVILASILSWKSGGGGGGGDGKCRLLASQLLSNLVTANRETADRVFRDVSLAPSVQTISSRLASSLSATTCETTSANVSQEAEDVGEQYEFIENPVDNKPTWVDMILASSASNQREVLSVVVAALHNGTASLSLPPTTGVLQPAGNREYDDHAVMTAQEWVNKVSSNSILVSVLLRHVLPATAVLGSQVGSSTIPQACQKEDDDHHDDGTEWICRFLVLLCRLGQLPLVYASARGDMDSSSERNDNTVDKSPADVNNSRWSNVVPEQVVLLYCLEKAMDDYTSAQRRHNSTEPSNTTLLEEQHPLGGEGGVDSILSSHLFLVSLVEALRNSLPSTWTIATTREPSLAATTNSLVTGESSFLNQDQPHLQRAATMSILQILADSLGIEQAGITPRLRRELAGNPETGLLALLCRDLALLFDVVSNRPRVDRWQRQQKAPQQQDYSQGSAGAKLHLNSEEQFLLTLLVRCLGNFCFQCRPNQDMMRLTLVPRATSTPIGKDLAEPQPDASINSDGRTALHVVMSCTSLGVACFTLREWAVVALRSMLQDNEGNQALAAQLEAQQPVQTAELDDMGIRVNMDSSGKVSVLPLAEPNNDTESAGRTADC